MIRSDLRMLVFQWLDDSDGIRTDVGGYFSNAIVNSWLNLALREVQKLLLQAESNWYLRCQTTATVLDQREYAIPTDFLKSHRLELTVDGTGVNRNVIRVQPITLNTQDQIGKGDGTPCAYILKKASFELYPAPDAVYPLELYYSYRVADMTADVDVPDCPEEYQELIAVIAAYNGFIKDDRVPSILQLKKEEYIAMMKKEAQERQVDQPRFINMTDDDGCGIFLF